MSKSNFRGSALALACATVFVPLIARGAPLPGGTLDPLSIPKYEAPLVIPPEMPRSTGGVDYQIAVRQFAQQVLPEPLPATTVWGYGSIDHPATFHYPSFTIEATVDTPVTVRWVNDLKDASGRFLPHLLPVDQTLHWANPPQICADGMMTTDCRGILPERYTGPVPMIAHLHGAHVGPESDGFPEAWYLPDAIDIPAGYATRGSDFGQIAGVGDVPGQAVFRYTNDQAATTLWFHDHSLGMTRVNVYAGPAGFYLLRGGDTDVVRTTGGLAKLPGPAPRVGDPAGTRYYEIPIVIQDRSFNADGSLFYADSRAFFDGFRGAYAPETDVAPIWNPEFFGNTMVVNGKTWPFLEVEARRYRFRFLNGSDSRFLILAGDQPLTFWQIGSDGGFLAAPVAQSDLLLGPAERADVIVDFSGFAPGATVTLLNQGPDEPFGGGIPGVDFPLPDATTTGQVMQFRVVAAASVDDTTDPATLRLPKAKALPKASNVRRLSLNEADSALVCVNRRGNRSVPCGSAGSSVFGPVSAALGTLDAGGFPVPTPWMEAPTENPALGSTEIWEIYNFTADAHPIHIHLVQFEVVNRQPLVTDDDGMTVAPAQLGGPERPPEPWESGRKDTVIVYPGELARVKATFDVAGQFVWHCHILSHEDNEMMRPYVVR